MVGVRGRETFWVWSVLKADVVWAVGVDEG